MVVGVICRVEIIRERIVRVRWGVGVASLVFTSIRVVVGLWEWNDNVSTGCWVVGS